MLNLLFVGRPVREKGFEDLCYALDTLLSYSWALGVVGLFTGNWKQNIVMQHNIPINRIRWYGAVRNDNIIRVMRSYDLVVIPSHYENFCNVALEAMAAECAVIASNCGGIPDLIEPGQNGLLFAPMNVSELANQLVHIFLHPVLVKVFGRNGCLKAKRYIWDNITAQTEQIILGELAKSTTKHHEVK